MKKVQYCISSLDGLRKRHRTTDLEMGELIRTQIIVPWERNYQALIPLYRYNPIELMDILDEMERRSMS